MQRDSSGFTLAELAIVTVIVGLLLGGLLVTLSTQLELRQNSDTQKTLEIARDALIGFAIANGRLPCPAVAVLAADTGVEAPSGGSTSIVPCTAPYSGYYPAVTVGLTPTDSKGYLLDSWGSRIRYAVTTATAGVPNIFTTANQMKTTGVSNITPTSPYLSVCNTATGMTTGPAAACASTAKLTDGAIAVIFSLGKNYATGGTGTDEAKNLDNDRAFVSHNYAPSGATNGEFDDLMVWLSPNVLYGRLAAAGAL